MNGVYKVSLGYNHNLLIKDGNLYAWGNSDGGKLGFNTTNTYESSPTLVSGSGNWTDISAGMNHSLGICGGYLYSWGSNVYGQLGLTYCDQIWAFEALVGFGHVDFGLQFAEEKTPKKVGNLSGWTKVSAGNDFSLGIRNGYLYGWGKNFNPWYVIGLQMDELDSHFPRQFIVTEPVRVSTHNNWTDISAGEQHTLGIQGGKLRSCGIGNRGILGDGDRIELHPTYFNYYSLAYSNQTTISDFSDNTIFSLLIEKTDVDRVTPLPTNTTWTNVSAGQYHSLGISGGNLYAWGYNLNGALGDGTTFNSYVPKLIENSGLWYKVSAGFDFSLGLHEFAAGIGVYEPKSWGSNFNSQLGNGTKNNASRPITIGIDSYSDISAGSFTSAGIESFSGNNKLLTWGFNILTPPRAPSSPNIIDPNIKIPVTYKSANNSVKKITAGWNDIFILNNNGSFEHVWFKGPDPYLKTVLDSYYYNEIGVFNPIKDISAGLDTFIVVREDNSIGVAGTAIDMDNISPRLWTKLNRRDSIKNVYCGSVNYGVVFDDGTAETWGRYKKIGNIAPINVDYKQIVSSNKHIAILNNQGEVYCFGDNSWGQCDVPYGLTGVKQIFVTETASGAVKENGDIVYWGNHEDGELGSQLETFNYSRRNPALTLRLPLNRKYKHNLIGYTFDGLGESLYKDSIKNHLTNYYNQLGAYPDKLILNIADGYNNELRWFNEPAKLKYLGFTLNASGISTANDGITYQNVWNSNFTVAPTTDEDFSAVLNTITNFYNHGFTLAKQAIYEITGNRDSIAVGFNTGSLLPDYSWVGFTATSSGFTSTSKISWATGNTLVNYLEFNNDPYWSPYVKQGPGSYLPVGGFDVSTYGVKNYSGVTADKKYFINSIGITSAVYTAQYNRWKQLFNNIKYDFILNPIYSKFILPTETQNTPVKWNNANKIVTDYETEYNKKLNKNLYINYTHIPDVNIGTTLGVVEHGPVLVRGATGISVNKEIFTTIKNASKALGYNSFLDGNNVIDNSILAIYGNTFEREAFDQWYYYGVGGRTYDWDRHYFDTGFTGIDWSVLQTELVEETYDVFASGKPNVSKYTSTLNYLFDLNSVYKNQFDFYNLKNITKIKSGKDHSILLDKFGSVHFLGSTLNNRQNISNENTYIDVSAGELHSAAIDTSGQLYTAGQIITDSGQCTGTTTSVALQPVSGTFDTVVS